MGKITSIYLTDGEAKKLEKFCEENQCTQYSVLKTAVRELLSKPIGEPEEESPITQEIIPQDYEDDEATEEDKQTEKRILGLRQLLRALQKTE